MPLGEAVTWAQMLKQFGVPTIGVIVTLVLMVIYAYRERRSLHDDDTPPWVRGLKKHISDHVDDRFDKLEARLREELREHQQDYKQRDYRQQRIENALAQIIALLGHHNR